ncbi:DNA-processing protein DprA [Bacillota bacterium LX-D]|nr:DNA-processing protein DprA [Bacillota bacterium LX-D]
MVENIYWHALNLIPGIGPIRFKSLIEYFGEAKLAWEADSKQLLEALQGKQNILNAFLTWRKKIDLEFEIKRLENNEVRMVTLLDELYPVRLRNIYDAPPVLYYKGSLEHLKHNTIAIVGSRKATIYGQKMTEGIARDLGSQHFCIISGMARGIDTFAHLGALGAETATIAVLGCGLDIIYPPENKKLMGRIIEKGAVISEFPLGVRPEPRNFPRRNRIISGLAQGVVVVEAAEKSGSLITADYALEQGKDVYAVPGSALSKYSKGTNHLIKQGAKLVESAADILEDYGLCIKSLTKEDVHLSQSEIKLVSLLSIEPIGLDELILASGFKPQEILSFMSILEIKGIIRQLPGQKYIINN